MYRQEDLNDKLFWPVKEGNTEGERGREERERLCVHECKSERVWVCMNGSGVRVRERVCERVREHKR